MAPLAEQVDDADTVIVPTWPVEDRVVPEELSELLRRAHDHGARIVGLCLGAFAVAATGLLDGRTAVTHWLYHDRFARQFPRVELDGDPLYIDHGSVVTSAGSAAALDCCIHLIRVDHGAEVATAIARSLVAAPHRSGGQTQFAATPPATVPEDLLGNVLSDVAANPAAIRSVTELAARASSSRRTLERLFRQQLGTTPRAWLTEQRLHAARRLLEETDLPVDRVASDVGLGSAPSLRREMQRALGTTPTAYRATFRG